MSIIEQGVGVLFRPIQTWFGAVATPAQQSGGILSAPVFGTAGGGGAYWFTTIANSKALRFYIPSRLWTTATDATDPGLTWGVHWLLGVYLSTSIGTSICQNSFRNGGQIQLSQAIANGRTDPAPSIYYPTPGVPEWISIQGGTDVTYLTVSLVLGSTISPQTPICPTNITLGQSWSS